MTQGGATSELMVVTVPELESGYRLAGAKTRTATTPAEAEQAVHEILREGGCSVLAVHEPFVSAFDARLRERLERTLEPVLVAIPHGLTERDTAARDRLAERIRRAIGYHVVFTEGQG